MRAQEGRRFIVAVVVFGSRLALLSIAIVACTSQVPTHEGSGWPNVALSAVSVTNGGQAITVTPITIGPSGAVFEVAYEPALLNHLGLTLSVDGREWPISESGQPMFESGADSAEKAASTVIFDNGGPSIGVVRLSIVSNGESFVFEWRI